VMRRTQRGWSVDVRSPRAGLALLAGAASLATFVFGAKLGHMSTPASIRADLAAEKHGVRCDVVYPSTTREQEANLLVKDCDEQVAAVERRLGTKGPARIRAWFFRDADDKKRLMGAAHTYIAKPWREEVYLQLNGYPHPVLGHELAHVIAGSFGRGPFRISGAAGGWLPNPGLIEGVAVFASPDDEDLTDAQWAHAMMRIGILPSMQRVFSLGFLGDASAKSYTLAGAFIEFVEKTYGGMKTVQAWYGGGDIEQLTGKSWAELDAAFRASLEKAPLPKEAEDFARAKFARPGIFGRKCPHVVDAIRHEADVCRDSQRYVEAIEKYERALQKDNLDWQSRFERAKVMRRHHPENAERVAGKAALEAMIADDKTPRSFRDRADEALADAELLDGDVESAARRYDSLAARSVDEDAARTLEVKAIAARDPLARPSVVALLLGDEKHGPDIFVGGVALGHWEASEAATLAHYLIGRNMVQRGFYEKGATSLEAALEDVLPSPRIERETLRQRAIAACALKDKDALAKVVKRIESDKDPFSGASGGRRDAVLRMIDRCAR
jgi:tetratricopeptide (TPR) repeat protein